MIITKELAQQINVLSSPDIVDAFNRLATYLDEQNKKEFHQVENDKDIWGVQAKSKFIQELRDLPLRIKDALEDSRIDG